MHFKYKIKNRFRRVKKSMFGRETHSKQRQENNLHEVYIQNKRLKVNLYGFSYKTQCGENETSIYMGFAYKLRKVFVVVATPPLAKIPLSPHFHLNIFYRNIKMILMTPRGGVVVLLFVVHLVCI